MKCKAVAKMKAAEALISWNANHGEPCKANHQAPPGSIGIGPLVSDDDASDWSNLHTLTAGAQNV